VYAGDAAPPAELRRDFQSAFVDPAVRISIDPDLQRSSVSVEDERVERSEQNRQRIGPVERQNDDAKVHVVRVRTRQTGRARSVRRRTVAGVADASADRLLAARRNVRGFRAGVDEQRDQQSHADHQQDALEGFRRAHSSAEVPDDGVERFVVEQHGGHTAG